LAHIAAAMGSAFPFMSSQSAYSISLQSRPAYCGKHGRNGSSALAVRAKSSNAQQQMHASGCAWQTLRCLPASVSRPASSTSIQSLTSSAFSARSRSQRQMASQSVQSSPPADKVRCGLDNATCGIVNVHPKRHRHLFAWCKAAVLCTAAAGGSAAEHEQRTIADVVSAARPVQAVLCV